MLLQCERSHEQNLNERAWLCSNKTLQKLGWIWSTHQSADPVLKNKIGKLIHAHERGKRPF